MRINVKLPLATFGFLLLFAAYIQAQQHSRSYEQAQKHAIDYPKPAPDFFEGALLGNGGLGVVVTTRPDAVVLYFGHNNVWDIRIAEHNKEKIGTFQQVFDKVDQIPSTFKNLTDDPWYRDYNKMTAENYNKPYPRPFPAGSIVLGFDRRHAELIGHHLDIANGICDVKFLTADKEEVVLQLFTEMKEDKIWMRLMDKNGKKVKSFFNRIRIMPDSSTPKDIPAFTTLEELDKGVMAFKQILPYQEPDIYNLKIGHPQDKAFSLTLHSSTSLKKKSRINWDGNEEQMHILEGALLDNQEFVVSVSLMEGLSTAVLQKRGNSSSWSEFDRAKANADKVWRSYWEKSGVYLSDSFLEQIWYRNLYFFNCAAKEGITAPGLFANWSYNDIGTAWHGDYHMNYNTQQPFWMTFSSNHLEKNLPYVSLVESLMDVARIWAKDYYQLPGAYFPHSAYPVNMTMNPYPVPDWGWEISETPWTVQGLWWHYLYSGDRDFLKERAYGPIKEAVEFMVAYMTRPNAKGGDRWKDDKYHIFPTVPPELYGLRPGFEYNYDVNIDLALTKFLFQAFIKMTKILGTEKVDRQTLKSIEEIQRHYPAYPTTISSKYGEVFVSVPGEHDQVVYNVPLPLSTVFPGEQHGLDSHIDTLQILQNTFRNQQNEGGNDLVFANLQAARIGMLDIEQFKRHINYSLLPNGTATDKVLQVHGRYSDGTKFDYMGKMGIWFENFGLPAVINECLLQSYNGTLRLFPNWPKEKDASFKDLRAVGAFLISATQQHGVVQQVEIKSEQGGLLRLLSPWNAEVNMKRNGVKSKVSGEWIEIKTKPGEQILLSL